MSMRGACWVVAILIAAQARADDASLFAAPLDPLGAAREVARRGDPAILRLIADVASPAAALAGIRGAPWMQAPETALPALIERLRGQDPLLGPEAARAVLEICRALRPWDLDRREIVGADLEQAIAELARVEADARVRHDLRVAARDATGMLRALLR